MKAAMPMSRASLVTWIVRPRNSAPSTAGWDPRTPSVTHTAVAITVAIRDSRCPTMESPATTMRAVAGPCTRRSASVRVGELVAILRA
jgi:hypothetical protein